MDEHTTTSNQAAKQEANGYPKISVTSYLPTALILMILGWGGLYSLIRFSTPNGGTRWLFFFAIICAVTGTLLLLVAFINRQFSSPAHITSLVIIRQSLWFGIYAATLVWLQIGRVLTSSLALLLAVGLLIIEMLLRLRERSQWKP